MSLVECTVTLTGHDPQKCNWGMTGACGSLAEDLLSHWEVVYQVGTLVLIQFKTFGTKKEFPSPAMTSFISVVSENSTQEALRGYPITTAGSIGTKTNSK